jgi:hypothetical protein
MYVQVYGGDANMYYRQAENSDGLLEFFDKGTQSIIFVSTIFVQYLKFTKITLFFLFGFVGYLGHIMFYLLLGRKPYFIGKLNIKNILVLLPAFHFWTSALGKDSLFYFLIMLFVFGLAYRKLIYILLSLVLMYLLRPHMAALAVMSIGMTFIFSNPLKTGVTQVLVLLFLTLVSILLLPDLKDFLGVDAIDNQSITNTMEFYNNYGARYAGGSSSYVDTTSYNLVQKLFSYMFRPLFYDARSILQFVISFENLFLLVLMFNWFIKIRFKIIRWFFNLALLEKILFWYVLGSWVILAANMYNLGLASRQKYMILPVLFLLMFANIKDRSRQNNIQLSRKQTPKPIN